MRERLDGSEKDMDSIRITPAYAGKTLQTDILIVPCKDHPGVCGKDRNLRKAIKINRGSPPRMRERQVGLCQTI